MRKYTQINESEYGPIDFASNFWEKVEPSWYHVWLFAQILIVLSALMWAAGQKIQVLIVAVVAMWLIAVTQKI